MGGFISDNLECIIGGQKKFIFGHFFVPFVPFYALGIRGNKSVKSAVSFEF